ncbi:MAG TPA: hypothetical protein DCO75_00580, partial [Fibrobacteres bacterium]|nr:hypothetical protein [Fibrobacterota bacterium]
MASGFAGLEKTSKKMYILMKPNFLQHVFLICSLMYTVCMAGSNEPAIMKTVRSMYSDNASIEISFNLHIFWKIREKEETKSGRIILARGEKFCVEIGASAWVSNGETLWQYSPDENGGQVVIKRLSDVDASALPSKLLSAYLDKYSYKLKEERKGVSIVECLPGETKQNSDALRIQISIETKSG